jgi:hypothetical protein
MGIDAEGQARLRARLLSAGGLARRRSTARATAAWSSTCPKR